MRLTMQDKNEFLKAALKAPDRDSLARWVVSIVDAIDTAEVASGKADAAVSCPPFAVPSADNRTASNGAGERRWEDATLT